MIIFLECKNTMELYVLFFYEAYLGIFEDEELAENAMSIYIDKHYGQDGRDLIDLEDFTIIKTCVNSMDFI